MGWTLTRTSTKGLLDLHELVVNGTLYVTIHMKDFPNGELRGNSFVGIDKLFPVTDTRWD